MFEGRAASGAAFFVLRVGKQQVGRTVLVSHRSVEQIYRSLKDAQMKKLLSAFLREEEGAITVDFVVLVAAICTLGLVVVTSISRGAVDLANEVEDFLDNIDG